MATFGSIASAAPNVLFDPARVDAQVQGFQRNQLLMQNAQQDQQQQTYQRDTQARIAMARELVNLPEDQAAAAWGPARQRLVAGGLGRDLPDQFPGLERIKAVASSDLTTFERLKIEQQREASAALAGLFGGAPVASGAPMRASPTPGYTPVSMPSAAPVTSAAPGTYQGGNGGQAVRSDNETADAMRQRINDDPNMTPEQKAVAMRDISMGRASALGQPGGGTYRANPGVGGVYAGVPAPGSAPVSAPAAPAPAGPALLTSGPLAGLTQEQATRFQALSRVPGTNPATLMAQVESVRQQNYTTQRQGKQDARQAQLDAEREERERRRDARDADKDARDAPTGPFRGTGLDAQANNTLLSIGPKISNGTATQAERDQYALAHGHLTQGSTQLVDDGKGGQVLARIPNVLPPSFPSPTFTPAPAGAPAASAPAPAGEAAAAGAAVPIQGANRSAPASAGDTSKLRQIETEAKGILDSLEAFRTKRAEASFGERARSAVGLPTELNSTYGNLALLAKGEALYHLGVLNGPDLEIIRRVVADPGTVAGGTASQETVNAQLDQIKTLLENRLSTARQQYGGGRPGTAGAGGDTAPVSPPVRPSTPRTTPPPPSGFTVF